MMSGKARYEEGAVYCDVAKPSTTLHCLIVGVDGLHRPHLVFCCQLTACDCSAIYPCTTTVHPHEPSSRHVRRLHVMLTADLQSVHPTVQLPSPRARHLCVQPTVQLSSPCATSERPRQSSSRNVAVSTIY